MAATETRAELRDRLDRVERKVDLLGSLVLSISGRPETEEDAYRWRSEWRAFMRGYLDEEPPVGGRREQDA